MCAKVVRAKPQSYNIPRRPQYEHPNPLQQKRGDRLAYLIAREQKTKEDIATYLGVTASAVDHWIKGLNESSVYNYAKLATYFSVTVDYLMCMDLRHLSGEQLLALPSSAVRRWKHPAARVTEGSMGYRL